LLSFYTMALRALRRGKSGLLMGFIFVLKCPSPNKNVYCYS
jgi:hypothetical protein